jgi:plastocyanin
MKKTAPATFAFAIIAAAAVLISGCGGSSASSTSAAATTASPSTSHIRIQNFAYSPSPATVKVGSTVVFTNEDSVEHTATSDSEGVFDSGTLNKGQSVAVKLNKVGTFTFHCAFHPFMHGSIKVVAG